MQYTQSEYQNIQVILRVRPVNNNESQDENGRCVSVLDDQTLLLKSQPQDRLYTFDYVSENDSQEDFFAQIAKGLATFCIEGFNCCVFAYGQTGSGKTHTMTGEIKDEISNQTGLQLRLLQYLFALMCDKKMDSNIQFQVSCSYFEIYNENILDLLAINGVYLKVRQDIKKGTYVENLSDHPIQNWTEVVQIIQEGQKNRKTASTLMNAQSSRSHSVYQVSIHSKFSENGLNIIKSAKLNFVDLAGSERQKTSGAQDDRLKEANFINKSLLQLGNVICQLVNLNDKNTNKITHHISYRNSKLTHLLQDCLGGNSKTLMIAAISPSSIQYFETLSTLKFAQNVKQVKNQAKVNEKFNCNEIKRLKEEIISLKTQIQFKSSNLLVETVHSPISYQIPLNVEILQRIKDYLQELMQKTDSICQCDSSIQIISQINDTVGCIQGIILSLMTTVDKYSRNRPQSQIKFSQQNKVDQALIQGNIPIIQLREERNIILNQCQGCESLSQNISNQREDFESQYIDMKKYFNMQIQLLNQENNMAIQDQKAIIQQLQEEIFTQQEYIQFNENKSTLQIDSLYKQLNESKLNFNKQAHIVTQANQLRDNALEDIYQQKKLIDKHKKQLEQCQIISLQFDLNQIILDRIKDELTSFWVNGVVDQKKQPWQIEAFKQSQEIQPIFIQLNHLMKICLVQYNK